MLTKIDISKPPYNLDINQDIIKGYTKILALPTRVLQAKEITALSLYPLENMKKIFDFFLEDSSILNGLKNLEKEKLSTECQSLVQISSFEILEI